MGIEFFGEIAIDDDYAVFTCDFCGMNPEDCCCDLDEDEDDGSLDDFGG